MRAILGWLIPLGTSDTHSEETHICDMKGEKAFGKFAPGEGRTHNLGIASQCTGEPRSCYLAELGYD